MPPNRGSRLILAAIFRYVSLRRDPTPKPRQLTQRSLDGDKGGRTPGSFRKTSSVVPPSLLGAQWCDPNGGLRCRRTRT